MHLRRRLDATDQEALNTWLSTWAEDFGGSSYQADLDELRQIIRRFQEWFTDGIYMVMGNHDLRIDKKTGGQVTLEMLLDDTEMQFSRYSYMYIWMPKLEEWVYVCHQFNYSRTSVKLAQDVWNVVSAPDGYDNATGERIVGYDEWSDGKNKQKCHVLVTHTHVAQDGFSPDGNWRTIGMGCMRDDKRTKYKRARATKFPEWNQGFVMLRDGFFHSFTKAGTDWCDVLGDDYYAMLMGSKREFSALYASDSSRHFTEETCEIDQSSALRKQRWTSIATRHLSVIVKGYTPRSTPLAVLASRPKDSAMMSLVARLVSASNTCRISPARCP